MKTSKVFLLGYLKFAHWCADHVLLDTISIILLGLHEFLVEIIYLFLDKCGHQIFEGSIHPDVVVS